MPPIMGDLHRVFESRRGGLTGTAGVLARTRAAARSSIVRSAARKIKKGAGEDARGRASVRTRCQQGESPCVVVVTPRVAEGNCVAARRGGKQPEAKE